MDTSIELQSYDTSSSAGIGGDDVTRLIPLDAFAHTVVQARRQFLKSVFRCHDHPPHVVGYASAAYTLTPQGESRGEFGNCVARV